MPLDPEAAYSQARELIAAMPDLREVDDHNHRPAETHRWLGRFHSLLEASGRVGEAIALRLAMSSLQTKLLENKAIEDIRNIAYRTLAACELEAPVSAQGSFIPVGHGFDAFAALHKVLGTASADVLIIDPYMDAVTVTDFVPLVGEGTPVRLLSDAGAVKSSLKPAYDRWVGQFCSDRRLTRG